MEAARTAAETEADYVQMYEAEQARFRQQHAEVKTQHDEREEELTQHAGALSRELEQVKQTRAASA